MKIDNNHMHLQVNTSKIEATGISDVGRVRGENEDAIWLDKSGLVLLVADGMGGHERGAEASQTAIKVFQELLNLEKIKEELLDITAMVDVPSEIARLFPIVDRAVDKTASILFERNTELQLKMPMGTTVVGLVLVEEHYVLWFHVGDSRIYRWRDSALECLTTDHSAYAEWVEGGRIGAPPAKNLITRALGLHPAVQADITWDKRQKNDIFILCSDGLTDMIADDVIEEILRAEIEVDAITQRLVTAALDAGGNDNTSVVVCKV